MKLSDKFSQFLRDPTHNVELSGAFEMFLQSSANSLEDLELCPIGSLLSSIKVPVLRKLKNLILHGCHNYRMFPRLLDAQNTFPMLQKVIFNFVSQNGNFRSDLALEEGWWNSIFDPDSFTSYFTSVQHLQLWNQLSSPVWIKGVRQLFPNVKILEIAEMNSKAKIFLEEIFRCWQDSRLEVIELNEVWVDQRPQMDSVFTGFSANMCKKLGQSTEIQDVSKLKKRPSIVNLHRKNCFLSLHYYYGCHKLIIIILYFV